MHEQKLLCDHSLEIPPFLQRNEDGSFAHPDTAIPVSATVTLTREERRQLDRWGWPVNEHDEKVKRELLLQEKARTTERSKESSKAARAKAKAEQDLKAQQLAAGRKNFMQHFQWDFHK